MATKGFVYVMSNKSMPGLIKVGMSTKVPDERAKELSSGTSTPTPFIVEYYAIFDDMIKAERMAHQRLKSHHHGKEFFSTTVENAIYSIEELGLSFKKLYSRTDYENEIRERRIKEKAAKEKEKVAKEKEKVAKEKETAAKERIAKLPKAQRQKLEEQAMESVLDSLRNAGIKGISPKKRILSKEGERSGNLFVRIILSITGVGMIGYALTETNLPDAVVIIIFGIGFIVTGNKLFK